MDKRLITAILQSGRIWWQAKYRDGRVLNEWDTLTSKELLPNLVAGNTSRWEEIPKDHMVGLRLLCPNALAGDLEAKEDHKFFQLKSGLLVLGRGNFCLAHIIGVVLDDQGTCFCRAWESRPKRLVQFYDNVFDMKYEHIGRLSLDVQQLRV